MHTLVVLSDKKDNQERLRVFTNNPDKQVIGSIYFKDSRIPEEICRDFANKYLGRVCTWAIGDKEKGFSIEYPILFEPTISHAFIKYFS